MRKWKRNTVILVIVVFIGINLFLLLKDKSKAVRTIYVSEWSNVDIGDIEKTFITDGVTLPESEYYVYSDEEKGQISSIEVEEGEIVSEGTLLFTYGTTSLLAERTAVEADIDMTESEVEAVTDQISELERITPSKSVSTATGSSEDSGEITLQVDMAPIVESDTAQAIANAEGERGKLEAKLDQLESKLEQINEQLEERAETSDVSGQVINVNKDGTNPIVTIASIPVKAEGVLSEQEMKIAAEGNQVRLKSALHKKEYTGTIASIMKYPENEPKLQEEAVYPFQVTLEEQDENLLAGHKLSMTVIVDQAEDVPIAGKSSVFRSNKEDYVYLLTSGGKAEKTAVSKGLSFEGEIEIKEGLIGGETVAANSKEITKSGSTFITPIKTLDIKKKEYKKLSKKQYAKYILIGMFER